MCAFIDDVMSISKYFRAHGRPVCGKCVLAWNVWQTNNIKKPAISNHVREKFEKPIFWRWAEAARERRRPSRERYQPVRLVIWWYQRELALTACIAASTRNVLGMTYFAQRQRKAVSGSGIKEACRRRQWARNNMKKYGVMMIIASAGMSSS